MGEDVFRRWGSSIQAEEGEVYMVYIQGPPLPVQCHFRHVKWEKKLDEDLPSARAPHALSSGRWIT